jgi:glycosyltransferase involved in cell wall biosynthesis
MIEAMACGTPVIALRRGSAPELVRDGVTGFVVDTVEEMAECVSECVRIDAGECRTHVEESFSPASMTEGYVDVYEQVLDRPRWTKSIVVDIDLGEHSAASDEAAAVA